MKKFLKKIDTFLLNNMFHRFNYQKNLHNQIKLISNNFNNSYFCFYDSHFPNLVRQLCDIYGSDKGSATTSNHPYPWAPHTYADYYHHLFSHCRHSIKSVFECGLGTNNPNLLSSMGEKGKPGASLRVWRDYFPNALIYGADIDREILFNEDRIKTFFIDQLNPDLIKDFWNSANVKNLDLIVDDGLHTFEAGITLFHHSIDKLSESGIYIIEDIAQTDVDKYKKFFINSEYIVKFIPMIRPSLPLDDNILIEIRKN
jgi:hypothetical protein